MTSSCLTSPRPPPTTTIFSASRGHHGRRHRLPPIASSTTDPPPSATSPPQPTILPLRNIPGDYGLPLISPVKDRLDYFYFQGRDHFFRSRIARHNSTVVRLNMPPGPLIASDPRVIALLDAASFPVLFDVDKVDKTDVFTGTYMPSVDLTGGYRVLSYLDPSEPKHALLKRFIFYVLSYRREAAIPEFRETFGVMFANMETEIAQNGPADFASFNEQASFTYLSKSLFGTDPASTKLGSDGPGLIVKWVLFQLSPLLSLGLPFFIEDLLLHTFRFPGFAVKNDYGRLYEYFEGVAASALEEAERMGISKEEACHNVLFSTCFNTFGGMRIFFPTIMKWVGACGEDVHLKLAAEVRAAVRKHGGAVTMSGLEDDMPLMKSVVYEALRIEPPVPLQYGRAKQDLVIVSHDAAFKVRKGEMLFGYQPFATKDGRVFDKPEEFLPDRFVGEEGEKLIRYILWSNGRETDSPTTSNKQCAGKEFVVLMARLLVVQIFLRYDSFTVDVGTSALGSSVKVTSLKKNTAAE